MTHGDQTDQTSFPKTDGDIVLNMRDGQSQVSFRQSVSESQSVTMISARDASGSENLQNKWNNAQNEQIDDDDNNAQNDQMTK